MYCCKGGGGGRGRERGREWGCECNKWNSVERGRGYDEGKKTRIIQKNMMWWKITTEVKKIKS